MLRTLEGIVDAGAVRVSPARHAGAAGGDPVSRRVRDVSRVVVIERNYLVNGAAIVADDRCCFRRIWAAQWGNGPTPAHERTALSLDPLRQRRITAWRQGEPYKAGCDHT